MEYINETLLLFPGTVHFRKAYPELVQRWERQIAAGSCGPDLYFCLVALDGYPRLRAYLDSREYLFDFVVNAHILYDSIVSRLVVDGHLEGEAVELANQEILSIYRFRNEDPEVMGDLFGAIYFGLFENGDESVGTESGRSVC
jgi:hypothetical protein